MIVTHRVLLIGMLACSPLSAQGAQEPPELAGRSYSAIQISGDGINLRSEVRVRIAAAFPLKMARRNDGDDRIVLVCNGVDIFSSGDGLSYYRGKADVSPQCDLPLIKFYELTDDLASL